MLLWLALAAQSVAVSAPPSPPLSTSREAAAVAAYQLRQLCISEAGIATAVEAEVDSLEAVKAQKTEYEMMARELGEAAYTVPIDIDRLERAAKARDANQAKRLAEGTRRTIATLRLLSPDDRVIYARRLSIYRPDAPTRTCPENVR